MHDSMLYFWEMMNFSNWNSRMSVGAQFIAPKDGPGEGPRCHKMRFGYICPIAPIIGRNELCSYRRPMLPYSIFRIHRRRILLCGKR